MCHATLEQNQWKFGDSSDKAFKFENWSDITYQVGDPKWLRRGMSCWHPILQTRLLMVLHGLTKFEDLCPLFSVFRCKWHNMPSSWIASVYFTRQITIRVTSGLCYVHQRLSSAISLSHYLFRILLYKQCISSLASTCRRLPSLLLSPWIGCVRASHWMQWPTGYRYQ